MAAVRRILSGLVLLSAASTGACQRSVTHAECQQLLDHATTLLAGDTSRAPSPAELERLKRRARSLASRDERFAYCSQKVGRRSFRCAMRASTSHDFERCLL